jgi:hypothetical protein
MTGYTQDIIEVLDCTEAEFNRAVRNASKPLGVDRQTYEELFTATRAAYQRFKAETDTKERARCYEI